MRVCCRQWARIGTSTSVAETIRLVVRHRPTPGVARGWLPRVERMSRMVSGAACGELHVGEGVP